MRNGYTDSDICTLYREAKDKRLQISILLQLTGYSRYELEKILEEGGYMELKDERKLLILEKYKEGLSDTQISRDTGIAQSQVSKFLRGEGLPANGKWKANKEEEKVENTNDVQVLKKDLIPKDEIKHMVEEVKVMLPKTFPGEIAELKTDTIETLTPGQYFYLAKTTLELLKIIWEG